MPPHERKRASAAITFIVFVDALGLSLVLPFLPLYARRSFGASAITIGVLVATFSLFQLFSAPVIGWFSDRRGRRPALIVTLVGSAVGFLALAAAQWTTDALGAAGLAYASVAGLGMLFMGRAINGIAGGNMPVAQAYLTDITEPGERAHAMGLVTTAFAVALGVGPLIAGYLATGDSFTLPALLGALASLSAAVFCWYALPETRPPAVSSAETEGDGWRAAVDDARHRLTDFSSVGGGRKARMLHWQWFLFILCFAMIAPMFPLIAGEYLNFDTRDIGHALALLAVLAVIWQTVVLKPLSARLSDHQLAELGLWSFLACFALVAVFGGRADPNVPGVGLALVVGLFGLGWAAARPAITSGLTKSVPEDKAGVILGTAQSVDSLATVFGPILTGAVLQGLGLAMLGGAAAAFSGLALLAGWAAHRPAPD